MPLLKLCRVAGCPEYAQEYGYCYKHISNKRKQDYRNKRMNPKEALRQQIYKDKRWAKTRALVLARDNHTCLNCGATEDLVVDHIYGVLFIDPYDPAECQTLCRQCSGRKDGARSRQG